MNEKRFRSKVDAILARRMIRESKEHFGPSRKSPAWDDVLCSWCGKEFNCSKKRTQHYCCDQCRDNARTASHNRGNVRRNLPGDKRAHRNPTQHSTVWLERIKERFGTGVFTSLELAQAYRADARRVRDALNDMHAHGLVVKCLVRGTYQWRVK